MKYFLGLLFFILIKAGSGHAQNASTAAASVSASIVHPAIISLENIIIEGPVQKNTSGLQSSPFIWLGKRVAAFHVEGGEASFFITAQTVNPAIQNLEVVEGRQEAKGKAYRIIPVFSGIPAVKNYLNQRCEVIIHFN